jgi:hypothetical protein
MKKELDAMILKLASHYDMKIEWCPVMERHKVHKSEKNSDFFWTSDESVEDFLDELALFFGENVNDEYCRSLDPF